MQAAAETCRVLRPSDSREVLALVRRDPVQNVLLEYLVRSGALGRVPGFYGHQGRDGIDAVLLIGVLGGAFLDARAAEPLRALGRFACGLPVRPRHITGPEHWVEVFWEAHRSGAGAVHWSRREPLYVITREQLRARTELPRLRLSRAEERDLEQVVAYSAQQHREDLREDRQAFDPDGFERRHLQDLRAGHWWIAREKRRVVFQCHVGPQNDAVVQLGGVFTPPELRGRGYATQALAQLCDELLERRPKVCLFCDEENLAARRVYERLGFAIVGHYRSILLES